MKDTDYIRELEELSDEELREEYEMVRSDMEMIRNEMEDRWGH